MLGKGSKVSKPAPKKSSELSLPAPVAERHPLVRPTRLREWPKSQEHTDG